MYRKTVESLGLTLDYNVQIENFCLAAAVLKFLDIPLEGMKDFYWPCRMERFIIPTMDESYDLECIVDGSHNGESVSLFLNGIRNIDDYHNAVLFVLFGAGSEKCVGDMIKVVIDVPDYIVLVQSTHFKSLSEVELETMMRDISSTEIPSSSIKSKLMSDLFLEIEKAQDRKPDGTVKSRLQWFLDQNKYVLGSYSIYFNICFSLCMTTYILQEFKY